MSQTPSYAAGTSALPLLGETIGDNLARTASLAPDSEALVDCATGRRWTYRQLDAAVDELALGLLELDLARGDRVGIWAPNCAEWVLVQYATRPDRRRSWSTSTRRTARTSWPSR